MPPISPTPSKDEIESFSISVVRTANEKGISCLDSLVFLCSVRNIEPEVAASLLDVVVKEKIQKEAEHLNFLKTKKSRLPLGKKR